MKSKIPYIHLYKQGGVTAYEIIQVGSREKVPKPPKTKGVTQAFFPQEDLEEVLQALPKVMVPTHMLA